MLYFTVVTKTHLPYAQVLMQRFADFDPASKRWVFLADTLDPAPTETAFAFEIIALDAYVAETERGDLLFQYTAFELCNALRAFAHQYVFDHTTHPEWMYFDADIYPLDSCQTLLDVAPDAFLFLCPHHLTPTPPDRILATDAPLLHRGVFNSGWMGVRRTPETGAFLNWFLERARLLFFVDYHNAFVDQLWLNFVPVLFPRVHIVRHPGANIAYWNLHERTLERDENGALSSSGFPALFFHFSGWSPQDPETISRHAPLGENDPVWTFAAHEYARDLLAAGSAAAENLPYDREYFADNTPIALSQRRAFYEARRGGEWPADLDPFTKPDRLLPPPPPADPEPIIEPDPEPTQEPEPEPVAEEPVPEPPAPPPPAPLRRTERIAQSVRHFWSRLS